MKTGIFGGTFNPVHNGHLIISEWIRCELNLDRIVFIPAYISPLKTDQKAACSDHRLAMLKRALPDMPCYNICDYELKKGGISYTENTIEWIRTISEWRNDDLYLIIGSDSLLDLARWKNPEHWLKWVTLAVAGRSDFDFSKAEKKFLKKVCLVNTPEIEISSTTIRDFVRNGRSIRFLLPEPVENYIQENGLYL